MDFSQLYDGLALGAALVFSPEGLFYCFLGVFLGTFIGVLPGIGPMATIAMLIPISFHLEPAFALITLAGIYYGASYGGSTASILLNLPGTSSSAVTVLDGYPMARQGRAGVALFITAIASFIGSMVGLVALVIAAQPLAKLAIEFSAPEYFSLMLLGLLAFALLGGQRPFRALAMMSFGLLLGLVGIDINSGQSRYVFGIPQFYEGLSLVALAMGLFGLPEIFQNSGNSSPKDQNMQKVTLRSMLPTREDWRRSWMPMLRGTGIGSLFGALPGTGGVIASFMSYTVEKRVSKEPERFGKGAIEGIASPEAANNAAVQTGFIPTLSLGVPGDAVMALMLGVLMIHGIAPGPNLANEAPDLFWGVIVSFAVGNVMLVILNIPLIGLWVRVLRIPYNILFPTIVLLVLVGVYSVNYSVVDIFVVMAFGVIGVLMRMMRFEAAPVILGCVLGPLMEENYRRALVLADGDFMHFVERPISAVLLMFCAALVVFSVYCNVRIWAARRKKPAAA
ncbi:tripartite tricarboxylate transporter permease [Aquamicrobium sp. LC103]|uniref:tripartite tricarboxylate transporter permease n=1 Tax=Aquamicrobium sp. LC103 TaxID=1120658 RepID=UPI00063E9A2D|nr:tripartite tricarboxylate transporter permease [Aquamicrobium sp. LC103]TKT69636.1 tripartite tricarboxylate transporter permease [Aquamicrobium sp. LC103]